MTQGLQMKREGIGGDAQPLGNVTCRQSLGPGLDEQAVNLETAILGQGTQGLDCGLRFHNSRIVEVKGVVKNDAHIGIGAVAP